MDERLMVEILIPVACMDSCLRIQKFIYFFFSESSRIIKKLLSLHYRIGFYPAEIKRIQIHVEIVINRIVL